MRPRLSNRAFVLMCSFILPVVVMAQTADSPKSTFGTTRVTLTFTNQTDLPVNINWIDYKGQETFNKFGVIGPKESRVAGQAQEGNAYRVRIHDPQCGEGKELNRVEVTILTVGASPVQNLIVTREMITPAMRKAWQSHAGC